MNEPQQYLRLVLQGVEYLLPSTAGFSIEQRDTLTLNRSSDSDVTAWRTVRTGRWPAYSLDAELRVTKRDDWQRAVFIDALPKAVGLIVDEVQMLPRAETQVAPFVPLGAPVLKRGHVFAGAWVTGKRVILVFDPNVLVAYLQSLGE